MSLSIASSLVQPQCWTIFCILASISAREATGISTFSFIGGLVRSPLKVSAFWRFFQNVFTFWELSLGRTFSAATWPDALETLTSKLDVIAQLTGKFLLETGGVLAGDSVLAGAPARRWTRAGQHLRADAQSDEIRTQAPLLGLSPRDPFLDAGDANTGQGEG
jgi:hypothetical protein